MERHVKVRGGHYARTKVLIRSLNEAYEKDETTEAWVENQIEAISAQKESIQKLNELILDQCEDVNTEIEKSCEFNLFINAALNDAKRWLRGRSSQDSSTSNPVKLPSIVLQKFSGNPLEWSTFWDIFKTSIHNRRDLSNAAKFYYLRNQLEGEASMLLKDFDHTDGSYAEAIELITKTYGRPKLLIQARLYALFDLVPPEANSTELGRFLSQYEAHLRGLKTLGANIREAGYIFAALLLRKLPPTVRNNIGRASQSDSWTLDELRTAIERELDLLRAAEESQDGYAHQPPGGERIGGSQYSSIVSINTNAKQLDMSGTELSCPFCTGKHTGLKCNNFSDCTSRKNRAFELGLCYNCLKPNHSVSSCRNNSNCRKCGRRHHTAICDLRPYSSGVVVSPRDESGATNLTILDNSAPNKVQCCSSLLPTGTLSVMTSNECRQTVRCLFDTGSQETCVTAELCERLKLKSVGSKKLRLEGINMRTPAKSYPIVNLSVDSCEGKISFNAIVVENLPTNISMPGRDKCLRSLGLSNSDLADKEYGDCCTNLNVLIGIDNYFKFMYGEQIHENVFVIPSRIGSVLAGSVACNGIVGESITTVLRLGATTHDDSNLNQTLTKFWELDHIGIKGQSSADCQSAIENFNDSITYENGRYTVSLPWKLNHPELPTIYGMARRRLCNTLDKLCQDSKRLDAYHNLIQAQVDAGFIEVVDPEDISGSNVHYFSHHAVKKDSKTTPLRIVYDCSAKCSKHCPSLNDCLESGPSLINDLLTGLSRFRLGRCA